METLFDFDANRARAVEGGFEQGTAVTVHLP